MARGRLISRSLGTASRKFHALHGVAGKLGEFSQSLYPLIVANTDDFGRLKGDAFTVKHDVFSTSPRSEADFEKALAALHVVNLVVRYEVGNEIVLQVVDFDDHQPGLSRRTASKFPPPPGDSGTAVNFTGNQESPGKSPLARVRGTQNSEGNGTEPNPTVDAGVSASPPDFDQDFWPLYPKHENEERARKEWDRLSPSAELWQAMHTALEAQRASPRWLKDSGQFIPAPATWLKEQRWKDQPGPIFLDDRRPPRRVNYSCRECGQMHVAVEGEARRCTGTWDT